MQLNSFKLSQLFIMKFTINLLSFLIIPFFCISQVSTDFPCYGISKNSKQGNVLYGYAPGGPNWQRISSTETGNLTAIAAGSPNQILYAFENNSKIAGMESSFGVIDPLTRNFNPTGNGSPGVGNGDYGEILLDNVTGLAYDNVAGEMYAVHSFTGDDATQLRDLLFKIDIATGKVLLGAMANEDGLIADYCTIEGAFDNDENSIIYNVNDIAINPATGELFAVYAFEDSNSLIKVIDTQDGTVGANVHQVNQSNIQALSFTLTENLYATVSAIAPAENKLLYINYSDGNVTTVSNLSDVNLDFQSIDCFQNEVDFGNCINGSEPLVLSNSIAPGIHQAVKVEDNINTSNSIAENSSVVLAAVEYINLQNINVPANCNLLVEVRPCGL